MQNPDNINHNEDEFRLPVKKGDFGNGNWKEILAAFYDIKESGEFKILHVAKFGVLTDPEHWGKILASMVRTIATGEVRVRGLPTADIEKIEAKIVEGFNSVIEGEAPIKSYGDVLFEDNSPPAKNWDPNELNW